jgi:hypothetical protein
MTEGRVAAQPNRRSERHHSHNARQEGAGHTGKEAAAAVPARQAPPRRGRNAADRHHTPQDVQELTNATVLEGPEFEVIEDTRASGARTSRGASCGVR